MITAGAIAAEFTEWGITNNSLETVERWAREGRISWDSYECYVFIWKLGAYKFSVNYPVAYNAGDVLVYRRVADLVGLGALALDCDRDLVMVDDDGGVVAWFASDDTGSALAYERHLYTVYSVLVLAGCESFITRAAWRAYQVAVNARIVGEHFRRGPGGRVVESGIPN